MRKAMVLFSCFLMPAVLAVAADLQMYFIDVEGGQATLIVAPSGESMLVDSGWPGSRDSGRIAAAAKLAGVKQIDYFFLTHHHLDHVGGIPDVAARIPVVTFVDHGPSVENDTEARKLAAAYEKTIAGHRHLVVKPGDRVPLAGVEVEVVAANGQAIQSPLRGAGAANAACAGVERQETDPTENARSAGFVLKYGKFRFADLGDLTWNKELGLVCPKNLLGPVSVYLVSHHGMDISNSPALVDALHPKVAIMNNGSHKGGAPKAWSIVRKSPGLEDLWQLHTAVGGGADHNVAEQFIANPEGSTDQGHWLKLAAYPDGTFTVTNSRNGLTKKY